jgi:hypothetical protein
MTRDEAVAMLRNGLASLPSGIARGDAFDAFDRLRFALYVETAESLVRQAHSTLVLALPALKPAADKLLSDCARSSSEPNP